MYFNLEEIELCNKNRAWKDCSVKTLNEYQKKTEKLTEKFMDEIEKIQELEDDIKETNQELNDTNDKIDIIKSKDNLTDDDNDEVIKLINQRSELRKKIREFEKEAKALDKETRKKIEKADKEMPKQKAKLVSEMVDITPEEYLENATDYDEFITQHLSEIRIQLLAGVKAKEIAKNLNKIIKNRYDESFRQGN